MARRVLVYPKVRAFYSTIDARAVEAAVQEGRGKQALLITVAFNRADLIQWQAELLNEHFLDAYHYVVADNSPVGPQRQAIRSVCDEMGATYIPLPPNPATGASLSHGLALNWVHRNVVEQADVDYVGYLDHDIFPIQDVSYRDITRSQRTFGHFQRAGQFHFYWPGLFFFASDFFRKGTADFRPVRLKGIYIDTGGGNWGRYYSRLHPESLSCFKLEDVWAHDPTAGFDKKSTHQTLQESAFTLFDRNWVHLVNGSNWAGLDTRAKTDHLRALLVETKQDAKKGESSSVES